MMWNKKSVRGIQIIVFPLDHFESNWFYAWKNGNLMCLVGVPARRKVLMRSHFCHFWNLFSSHWIRFEFAGLFERLRAWSRPFPFRYSPCLPDQGLFELTRGPFIDVRHFSVICGNYRDIPSPFTLIPNFFQRYNEIF